MLLAVWRMMGWADTVMEADVSSVTLSVTLCMSLLLFGSLSLSSLISLPLCSLGDASNKEG